MQIATSLQQIQPSYLREILAAASSEGVISFAGGLPDASSFPMSLMQQSLHNMADKPVLFQYAGTQGYPPLLSYCAALYQLKSENLSLICNGSQQGLDLIARAFINPGDCVVMEAPSYLGALQVFGLAQANILSVNSNQQGPDLNELEQCFRDNQVKIFYAVPDFHNPTGVCWSLATRLKVAQLCCEYNVTLLEDVPYRELHFSGESLPLVSSFCVEHSIVLRSFSKFIAPGMRLGVVSAKANWINALIKVKQAADLHTNIPMQALLLDILQHPGFATHLVNLRKSYAQRYAKMAALISEKLDNFCQFEPVTGGMFIWLSIKDCNVMALAERALTLGVSIVPSDVFYTDAKQQPSALRLNFSHTPLGQIATGIDRLSQSIKDGD